MTTTPSTASQAPAVSIDTPEFQKCIRDYFFHAINNHMKEGSSAGRAAWSALISHIDAKLAQAAAAETARCQEIADARQRGWDSQWDEEMAKARVQIAEQEREKAFDNHPELLQLREQNKFMLDERDSLIARATAAEAKLEAIRQGVRECVGFGFDKDGPNWISRHQVLALFESQPQADESGLPG